MAQLEPYQQEIERLGAGLVFIAAQKRKSLWKPAKCLAEHPTPFPFLLDEDRAVTKAYGLYHALGSDAIRIAHPATLIIDRSGIVRYVYRGDNQFDRVSIEEVLAALRPI